jgi:short-subunit dehydrogenase
VLGKTQANVVGFVYSCRSELRPFGIDVVLLLPGAVRSNIGNTSTSIIKSEVLEGLKIFQPWEKVLMERVSASQSSKSTPTAVFVKKAVAQVLAKSPPAHFAYGHLATLFSIMYYMPFWFRDFVWSKYYNLDKSVVRAYNKKLE